MQIDSRMSPFFMASLYLLLLKSHWGQAQRPADDWWGYGDYGDVHLFDEDPAFYEGERVILDQGSSMAPNPEYLSTTSRLPAMEGNIPFETGSITPRASNSGVHFSAGPKNQQSVDKISKKSQGPIGIGSSSVMVDGTSLGPLEFSPNEENNLEATTKEERASSLETSTNTLFADLAEESSPGWPIPEVSTPKVFIGFLPVKKLVVPVDHLGMPKIPEGSVLSGLPWPKYNSDLQSGRYPGKLTPISDTLEGQGLDIPGKIGRAKPVVANSEKHILDWPDKAKLDKDLPQRPNLRPLLSYDLKRTAGHGAHVIRKGSRNLDGALKESL